MPVELDAAFDHADFVPEPTVSERMGSSSIMRRLDEATAEQLMAMAKGVL